MNNKIKRSVKCGDVSIGGMAPISIQSMCNVKTEDVVSTLRQIEDIKNAGGHIVRLAIPNEDAANAFLKITKKSPLPLVADIHFDYRLAILAIKNGASKIRINPGNIGDESKIKKVVLEAKAAAIPIRVGVNSGSLEKEILEKYQGVTARALWESCEKNARLLESMGFYDIVVSLKSSDPMLNFNAYKLAYENSDYPIHIGVTETGMGTSGEIKSAVGIGGLLLNGIGNTMRVSLTGDPTREIEIAKEILSASGIVPKPINIVACPTCGRTGVNLESMVKKVEAAMIDMGIKREKLGLKPLNIAVMGCAVNGPGEAREADLGVACGPGSGLIFLKGEAVKKVKEDEIVEELVEMVRKYERNLG